MMGHELADENQQWTVTTAASAPWPHHLALSRGAYCTFTSMLLGLVFSSLGRCTHRTPFLNSALRRVLVLDNASWHKVKTLNWHHFEALFLPPYSPDFNPIERLWLRLTAEFFADWIARTGAELEDRLCHALNHFMSSASQTASICSIRK